ncbi:unnamed protein product [Ceratitis capitata]|uniref:(Mediterranean fruit fly) hypothetical protein n=1 Tax=Ceratitis capitata TaxID=7213 RepID=A0A811V768_CERCA|nr:unnamed protein product [Ceratitis capitata]
MMAYVKILNDPKARNTLSREVMTSIQEGITKDVQCEDLRCIAASSDCGHEIFSQLVDIIMNIYKSPVPIIAKVNGMATAAGLQLAASVTWLWRLIKLVSLRQGLASVVVPEAQLDAETNKITQAIKRKTRAILAMGKAFYYKQLGLSVKDASIRAQM